MTHNMANKTTETPSFPKDWPYRTRYFERLVRRDTVFSRCEKKLSFQFFDLDIENTLGGGTLAKIQLPLCDLYRADRL